MALFNADHVHHTLAHDWFSEERETGWATCPLTENGFVRLLAQPASGLEMRSVDLIDRLSRFCASRHHVFWPDALSLCDASLFNQSYIVGHRQLTDVYLLGLAVKMGGRLATCDRSIPLGSVLGATTHNIAVLAEAGAEQDVTREPRRAPPGAGAFTSGTVDTTERVDEILAETNFGAVPRAARPPRTTTKRKR